MTTHPADPTPGHHSHSHSSRPGHGPATGDVAELADLAEILDLDAVLGAPVLAVATDAAVAALGGAPRVAVDLGAGTGTGSLFLADRFAGVRVHALDASSGMLDRLRASSATADVDDRVEAHQVDLDGDWPAIVPRGVDLAWAALSLHHVTDAAQVLRQAFDVLRPGGVLVVTEFTGTTTFTPGDLGTGVEGLGARLVGALAARGYPVTADWTAALDEAGFAPVERRESALVASAATAEGARYLALHLARNRDLLAGDLSVDDVAALDAAIGAVAAGASDLHHESGRAIWIAVRPAD
jgi:ubiquinone/menaquinone biosynthesis C-methylase UbiE